MKPNSMSLPSLGDMKRSRPRIRPHAIACQSDVPEPPILRYTSVQLSGPLPPLVTIEP
jgi:hypothetical protein